MFRLIVFTMLTLLSQMAMALSYTLELSEEKLQNEVSAMMPMVKKNFFFTVTLSDPKIELIEGRNEISIFTHVDVVALKGIQKSGIRTSGTTKIIGSLSYQAETSEFFFQNPTIEELEIKKVSDEYVFIIKAIVQRIARKMLVTQPIYRLKDNNFKDKLAKAMLQSVSVENKKLVLELTLL